MGGFVVGAELFPEVVQLDAISSRLAGQQLAGYPEEVLPVEFESPDELLHLAGCPPSVDSVGWGLQEIQNGDVDFALGFQQRFKGVLFRVASEGNRGRPCQFDKPGDLLIVLADQWVPVVDVRMLVEVVVAGTGALRNGRLVVVAEVDAWSDRKRRFAEDV